MAKTKLCVLFLSLVMVFNICAGTVIHATENKIYTNTDNEAYAKVLNQFGIYSFYNDDGIFFGDTEAVKRVEAAKALVANGVIAVSEGANMPSTPGAIRVFQEAKILYSPGKASNAGGVSVSGLEMSQNSERLSWTAEEVDNRLHAIMENIHANCVKYGTEPDGYANYVKGANVAGFMKVAKAMMAQGIV